MNKLKQIYYRSHISRLLVLCLLLASGLTSISYADRKDSERVKELKAVFILNFAKFAEWPEGAFKNEESPIILGILDLDALGDKAISILEENKIKGRRTIVRACDSSTENDVFHILYLNSNDTRKFLPILKKVKNKPVLTIGDSRFFTESDGIIEFKERAQNLRFVVNVNAVKMSNLKLSSRLLELGTERK